MERKRDGLMLHSFVVLIKSFQPGVQSVALCSGTQKAFTVDLVKLTARLARPT